MLETDKGEVQNHLTFLLAKVGTMNKAHYTLLLGIGLSFICPFFWWTFFYVSTFGSTILSNPTIPSLSYLASALIACILFTLQSKPLARFALQKPWSVFLAIGLAVMANLLLFFIHAGVFSFPAWISIALAIIDGICLCLVLFAWGVLLTANSASTNSLVLKDYALALGFSFFLFFVYVLLFIAIPSFRFLLCVGALFSAGIWFYLYKQTSPSNSLCKTDASDDSKHLDSSLARFSSPSDWLLLGVSYLATSIVYWLLFTCDAAHVFSSDAFALLGNSPIAEGQPFLYALFALFLIVLFIVFLLSKQNHYYRFLFAIQSILAVCTLISLFVMMYLVPDRIDFAEGINCLIRADVQIALFTTCLFMTIAKRQVGWMLIIPGIDALLLLGNSILFTYINIPQELIAHNIQNVAFMCGCLVAVCFATSFIWTASRLKKESYQEEQEHTKIATLASTYNLSEREREVLLLAAKGYTAKAIAQTLHVSQSTAQTHISRIYTKMEVHSKQELISVIERFS